MTVRYEVRWISERGKPLSCDYTKAEHAFSGAKDLLDNFGLVRHVRVVAIVGWE